MFRCKLQIVIIAFIATMSFPSLAQESRVNTLECSDDEVKAYMDLADKSRFNELGFGHFESAYIVTVEEERAYMVAAGEVGACMGVLYGDISNMAKSVKDSLSGLSFGIGDLKEKATQQSVSISLIRFSCYLSFLVTLTASKTLRLAEIFYVILE